MSKEPRKGAGVSGIREGFLERIGYCAAYLYIGLPIIIFILGWIRWPIAVPLSLIIIISFFLCLRDKVRASIDGCHTVSKSTLLGMLLVIVAWVYLSGIGGYVYQNGDHTWRNEMFRVLTEKAWPVSKTLVTDSGYQTKFISYYIGFWLPAVLFGKLFGMDAGYAFQFVWAIIGIAIMFIMLSRKIKKWSVVNVLVFALFSGLDIVGCLLTGQDIFGMSVHEHIELWSNFQYSSHTTQLFWVYNQAIYAWVLTILLMSEEDNKRLILIWSCGLLECTFPFVGMLPILIYRILTSVHWKEIGTRRVSEWTGGLFSFENILGGGIIGIISFLFLFNNSGATTSRGGIVWTNPANVFVYLLFVFLEAGVYVIAVYKDQRRNPLLWISLVILLLCPAIRIGYSIDFCMRVSMPALMVLCVMVMESLNTARLADKRRYYSILAVFLIGAVTPIHEIARATINTYDIHIASGSIIGYVDEDSLFISPNFTADAGDSLFAKHFLKLDKVWRYGRIEYSKRHVKQITDGRIIEQRFKTSEDINIGTIYAMFATYGRTNTCTMDVMMMDPEGNATTVGTLDCSTLEDGAIMPIAIEPYSIQKGKEYSVQFIPHGASKGNAVTIYRTEDAGQDWEYAVIDGKKKKYDLAVAFGE